MTFIAPVKVAELMTFRATVNAAWNTSMEVGVRVEAENPRTGESRHTSTAYLTMVALDDAGEPTAVPPLAVASERSCAGSARPNCAARTGSPSATRSSRAGATSGYLGLLMPVRRSTTRSPSTNSEAHEDHGERRAQERERDRGGEHRRHDERSGAREARPVFLRLLAHRGAGYTSSGSSTDEMRLTAVRFAA